jgi:hypothetical protein
MAVGCAGAALVAAGCGLTNTKTEVQTQTVTVTRTVTHTVTASAAPPATSNACTASDLTGTFAVLAGSAGAGNILYTLHVTNASQDACTVSGPPAVTFLDASGAAMNQHTSTPDQKPTVISLQPGASASAQVRFSPDVTPCDPGTATTLRVEMPDKSTFTAKFDPATKLCGAGSVQPSNYTAAD